MQARELVLLDPLGGELRREALELRANLVRLTDLARVRHADDRASVRLQLDDAVRLKLAQRLPYRRATDLELRGQHLLAKPRAARDLAAQHAGLERGRDAVDERISLGVAVTIYART